MIYILVVFSFVSNQDFVGDINPSTGRRMGGQFSSHIVTMQEFSSHMTCENAKREIQQYVARAECMKK